MRQLVNLVYFLLIFKIASVENYGCKNGGKVQIHEYNITVDTKIQKYILLPVYVGMTICENITDLKFHSLLNHFSREDLLFREFGKMASPLKLNYNSHEQRVFDAEYKKYINYYGISFKNSIIKKLTNGLFKDLPQVTHLYLNFTAIEHIESGALSGMPKLTELFLGRNKISKIEPGILNGLSTLQVLDLSFNRLENFHYSIFRGMVNLHTIDLSNNIIVSIPENFFYDLPKIIEIDLSVNRIASLLPETFQNITNLNRLHLNWNHLTTVNRLGLNGSLDDFLDLSGNLINTGNFAELTGKVYLQNNEILHLSEFGPNVTQLYLSHNLISEIPSNKFQLSKKLLSLHMDHNTIFSINRKAFLGLTMLTCLNLSHNSLENLETEVFEHVPNLETLDLSSNYLQQLNADIFSQIIHLQNLYLNENKLKQLDEHLLFPLSDLRILRIDGNSLTEVYLTDLIKYSPNFRSLNLNGNMWQCKLLIRDLLFLEASNVEIIHGTSFKTRNFKGIPCSGSKLNEITSEPNTQIFVVSEGAETISRVPEPATQDVNINNINVIAELRNASIITTVLICFILVTMIYYVFLKKEHSKNTNKSISRQCILEMSNADN